MKWKVSKSEQRVLALAVVIVGTVAWVFLALILGPLVNSGSKLSEGIRQAREQLRAIEVLSAEEPALDARYRVLAADIASYQGVFPTEDEVPAIIELLSDLATQTNVKVQTIAPKHEGDETGESAEGGTTTDVKFAAVTIQIDALAGYHQFGTFLSLVETDKRPIQVASLQIKENPRDPNRHQIKLLLKSYFARQPKTAGTGPGAGSMALRQATQGSG